VKMTKKKAIIWIAAAVVLIAAAAVILCMTADSVNGDRLSAEEAGERLTALCTENDLNNGFSSFDLPAAIYISNTDNVVHCKITSHKKESVWCQYYEAEVIKDSEGIFKKGDEIRLCGSNKISFVSLPDIKEGMEIVAAVYPHEKYDGHYHCSTSVTYYVTEDDYAIYALGDRIEDLDVQGDNHTEDLNFYGMPFSGMRTKTLMKELNELRIQRKNEEATSKSPAWY